jgi:hypothetical protein
MSLKNQKKFLKKAHVFLSMMRRKTKAKVVTGAVAVEKVLVSLSAGSLVLVVADVSLPRKDNQIIN